MFILFVLKKIHFVNLIILRFILTFMIPIIGSLVKHFWKSSHKCRVPTPQGKPGKWWKVIPDRKTRGIWRFWKNTRKRQGIWNFKIESWNQESRCKKNSCVMSMVLFLRFKMLSFWYKNTQDKLKLHRENIGNFAFRDEWEPCYWKAFPGFLSNFLFR